jgi:hypothetical protein
MDSKSPAERRAGSIPASGTKLKSRKFFELAAFFFSELVSQQGSWKKPHGHKPS